MNSNYPTNLYGYYQNDTSSFEERTNTTKKIMYYGLLGLCVLLLVVPTIIPLSTLIVRIGAIIGAIFFGFAAFLGGKDYYSKRSGGIIKSIAIKKFDSSAITEQQLLSLFDKNDVLGLSTASEADNQPLQIYIHEDELGKVFYLQLMKYFSQSDFRGMSAVKVISEPEYSVVYKTIKGIKST